MAEHIAEPEQWRPVVGYEDLYEISDRGRMRSLGRFIRHPRTASGVAWRPGQIVAGAAHDSGHIYVSLSRDGDQRVYGLHRLVLLAFVGEPPPGKPNALHRNDKPGNNALANLYWGSHRENSYDAVRNGSHTQARKLRCPLDHLLAEPNLVPSTTAAGGRSCLACKLARACHYHDEKLRAEGHERTRYNRGRDRFRRRAGETWQEEAHRRYAHIMDQGA